MREQKRENGRKSSGRKGDKHMRKGKKRHPAAKAGGRSSWMGRGKLALLAFAVATMAAVALARTCDPNADPTLDDADAPGSCSDDAASCVALA
jgi:hypothetical protein